MENQNQQQTQVSQVPELHKRHFKSFWPIVIIAVLSALVGGILVFLLFNQGLDEELNSLLPGSSYRQTHEQVKDKENNVPTWQTYKNEEYGFELKYPGDWGVIKVYDEDFLVQPDKEGCRNASTITVNCVRLEINFNVQTFVDYEASGNTFKVIDPEKLKVSVLNNNSFWVLEDEAEGMEFKQFIIKDKYKRYYSFTSRMDVDNKEQQLIDQILSTFKFIE